MGNDRVNSYTVIDEPRPRPWHNLIAPPILILLAAILLPMFWNPPLYGRVWLPMLWLAVNGLLLGSPSLKKEWLILASGLLGYAATLYGGIWLAETFLARPQVAWPYLRILLQGVLFFVLYLVVFIQSAPYELFTYLRKHHSP